MKAQWTLIGGGVAMWLWSVAVLGVSDTLAIGAAMIGLIVIGSVLLRKGK